MFQKKCEIFKELPNVFGIAEDILIVGYNDNGTDHDKQSTEYYRCEVKKSLSLTKTNASLDACVHSFGEIFSRLGVCLIHKVWMHL